MMSNMLHKIWVILLLMMSSVAVAQVENLIRAQEYLRKSQLDSSRIAVEKAQVDPATQNDAMTWYLSGFTYKELYKIKESGNMTSPFREKAVNAFKKSVELDTSKQYVESNLQNLKNLASKYYNDAVTGMDSVNEKLALENYRKFKELNLYVNPKFNFQKVDLSYYGTFGTVYSRYLDILKKKDLPIFLKSVGYYQKALEIAPNDTMANYNIAILYYNQGVTIINNVDFDIPLVRVDEIQDSALTYFKKAEPFMLKAYQLQPSRKEILMGLSGIYFSLRDNEKYEVYRKMLEDIKKPDEK